MSEEQELTKEPVPEKQEKEKAFSSINFKSFLLVVGILLTLVITVGVLTYFIPQGAYQYAIDANGNSIILPGTYVQGEVKGIAIWRILTAPFRVFAGENALSIIFISLFLLIMSGVFNVMDKTNGVKAVIRMLIKRFSQKKRLLLCIMVLAFMMFGSFFGMFEELVALLPIVIVLMLSLGFDTMTGLGVCMLAACFGFSSAITNPFSVGIASEIAGTSVFDGVWLRIVFFVLIYALVCGFIIFHTKRIAKNPLKSPTYALDTQKRQSLAIEDTEIKNEGKICKAYAIFFGVLLVILVAVAAIRAISGFAIPILCVAFLAGGIWAGLATAENKKQVFIWLGKGAISMLPAVLMIALASSVSLVLTEGGIKDTILYEIITFLEGRDKFTSIILLYILILVLQLFIGSASAKLYLIMPLALQIGGALGLSPAILILTYCMADGFTDMIIPTNPVLLVGLSIADVSYGKWFKWTGLLQVLLFGVTLLILLFAVSIGY